MSNDRRKKSTHVDPNDPQARLEALARELGEREEELSPEQAADLYHQMGDIEWARGGVAEALGHFDMALLGDPGRRGVLASLTAAYGEARRDERWDAAAGCLHRLIEAGGSPARVAKLHYAMGVLQRDKLGDVNAAVHAFEASLKQAPHELKAFEAIDRILTEHKAWDRLESAYRVMIGRLQEAADGPLLSTLWRNLGEVYRSRLQRMDAAITAFEMAARLCPDDVELREIVVDLCEREGAVEKAIEHAEAGLARDPSCVGLLRVLARQYRRVDRLQEAWRMAAALCVLREADEEERRFHEELRPMTPLEADGVLDHRLWATAVVHPRNNLRIGNVFAMLVDVNPFAEDLSGWGVGKSDRLDLAEPTDFNRVFHSLARMLQLGDYTPEVYLKEGGHAGLANGNTRPRSLIIGPDVLSGTSDLELRFLLGRHLSLMRLGQYFAAIGQPSAQLRVLFFATWKISAPSVGVPAGAEGDAMDDMVAYLADHVPASGDVELRAAIEALASHSEGISLSGWIRGVEYTADRVGLLLCGDLETAARLIRGDLRPVSKATSEERVEELVRYALSSDYGRALKGLGLLRAR